MSRQHDPRAAHSARVDRRPSPPGSGCYLRTGRVRSDRRVLRSSELHRDDVQYI